MTFQLVKQGSVHRATLSNVTDWTGRKLTDADITAFATLRDMFDNTIALAPTPMTYDNTDSQNLLWTYEYEAVLFTPDRRLEAVALLYDTTGLTGRWLDSEVAHIEVAD